MILKMHNPPKGIFSPSIPKTLFYLAVATSSFDLFLIIKAGGFNVRFAQLVLIPLILFFFAIAIKNKKLIIPIGSNWLLLWTLIICITIPNTNFLARNIGYALWLIFNVCTIFVAVNLFTSYKNLKTLARIYIFSFFIVSAFGIFQFFSPFLGLPPFLIQQWWFSNLPRINAFSYEPSYLASYLIMGWILLMSLLSTKTYFFKQRLQIVILVTISLALLLSSSRMGYLIMILYLAKFPMFFCWNFFSRFKINRSYLNGSLAIITLTLLVVLLALKLGADNLRFLMAGMDITDPTSHSATARTTLFRDTLRSFLNSPIVGYSLGGIPSAIGELYGEIIASTEAAKDNEGISIFAEVLAASGVIGFIPFAIYIAQIIYYPFKVINNIIPTPFSSLLNALVISLIFELLILQFNQNILRPTLWVHIAILSTCHQICVRQKKMVAVQYFNPSR